MELKNWLEENFLTGEIVGDFLKIEGFGKLYILKTKLVFKEEFQLNLPPYITEGNCCYLFGEKWYYSPVTGEAQMFPLKYIGVPDLMYPNDYPFCGVHGHYEITSGVGKYSTFCKKANFLGIKTLGLCEENTLAGVISFQDDCKEADIRSIIGETFTVQYNDLFYKVKVFAKNKEGWAILLALHYEQAVLNNGILSQKTLLEKYTQDILIVLTPTIQLSKIFHIYEHLTNVFFAWDLTEYSSQEKDGQTLTILQQYLSQYKHLIKGVLLSDCYYLEKSNYEIRRIVGQIGKNTPRLHSENQFFKSVDDYLVEGIDFFEDKKKYLNLITQFIDNTTQAFSNIDFSVTTGKFFLPDYIQSETEKQLNLSNRELFLYYVEQGIKVLFTDEFTEEYRNRVNYEIEVLEEGGFLDYFLVLYDLYREARERDIWYGIGRGSAAGSLVSYLLLLTGIEPIKEGLLFERFLNRGRIGKSLPDIDCDFQGTEKDNLKKYLEQKYGREQIVFIGAYGTFRIKAVFKDVSRAFGLDVQTQSKISGQFEQNSRKLHLQFYFKKVFEIGQVNKVVYDFVQKYPQVINTIEEVFETVKNATTHASGLIFAPNRYGTAAQQFPVKLIDGQLVSEWESKYLDQTGYLKIDLLGIAQFDKFKDINALIQQTTGRDIRYKDIPYGDKRVFELFSSGFNEDVFQLGGVGLKNYCIELKPETLEDIKATIALYRPGPMDNKSHTKYARAKNDGGQVSYYEGCEELTKTTFGLIVYQEQTMAICRHVGGFTLVEADDVRKAMVKMSRVYLDKYKDKFFDYALKNGRTQEGMEELWNTLLGFSGYAFNASHASCYAVTAYYSQWFKANYPLEFWTVSLQYSDVDEIGRRTVEISKMSEIGISGVDINNSITKFKCSKEKNKIYWSLISVKFVGEAGTLDLINERNVNGMYFSISEFQMRMKGRKGLNSRSITNLIICGAFDELYNIKRDLTQRYKIIEEYFSLVGKKVEELNVFKNWKSYHWAVKQKELTGFSLIDYEEIFMQSHLSAFKTRFMSLETVQSFSEEELPREPKIIIGTVMEITERTSKNGLFFQVVVQDNTDAINITIWTDTINDYNLTKTSLEGRILAIEGRLFFDDFRQKNGVQVSSGSKLVVF